jgi:carbonic anhydrase/acetyltransferase-like protein (isoleucine patch superfamily)
MADTHDRSHAPDQVLEERLVLDPSAFVAPGATVVGRVTLGARASVWFGAVMRGDMDTIALGDESNLQDGAVIHVDDGHPTTVGRRVTIGHRAIVHAASVEDGCMIGMGAIVLTGAVVGAGSLVGAGALVREGQVVPPGSLVLGAPARVVGPVKPEHTEAIRAGVDHYVALGQAYRAKGYAASFPSGGAGLVQRAILRDGDVHWDALLTLLRSTPARIAQVMGQARLAALRAHPVTTAWSALETLGHLRDVESDVYAPRLAQLLAAAKAPPDATTASTPVVLEGRADVNARNAEWLAERDYAHAEPDAALAAFAEARAHTLAVLAPCGPREWAAGAIHPSRGAITLYEQVERMAEHDLGHLRQIERALHRGTA